MIEKADLKDLPIEDLERHYKWASWPDTPRWNPNQRGRMIRVLEELLADAWVYIGVDGRPHHVNQKREGETEMTLKEMLVTYNNMVAELVSLGGVANPRKAFAHKAEADKALSSLEARLQAKKAEAAPKGGRKQKESKVSEAGNTAQETAAEKKLRMLKGRDPAPAITPMREDSIRARILQRLDGTRTPKQIAAELGLEEHKVPAHLNALHKYAGIGYAYDENRRVKALYPKGGTFQAAIKAKEGAAA